MVKNMLKPYIPKYPLRFYPLPFPDKCFAYAYVYIPSDIIDIFYSTYSLSIDDLYLHDIYDERTNYSPHGEISDIFGEEAGYLYNLCKKSNAFKGILIKSVMTGRTIPETIDEFRIQYYRPSFIDEIIGRPCVQLNTNSLSISEQNYLSIVCDTKDHRRFKYSTLIKDLIKVLNPGDKIYPINGGKYQGIANKLLNLYTNREDDYYIIKEKKKEKFRFWGKWN